MSSVFAEPLIDSLTLAQKLTSPTDKIITSGVRLHLLKYGSPTGNLFVQIQNSSKTLILASANVAISAIGSNSYWHGYVAFDLSLALAASTAYYISLGFTSYTYSAAAHMAWANDYGLRRYTYSGDVGAEEAPFDVEWWQRNLITKGTYP